MADVLVILIACMVFLSLFLGAKNVFANSFLTCTARLMMMMMNSCCGMVDRREALNLISSRDYCQRFWPSQISDTMPLGFEPTQNLSSDLVGMKWSSGESQVSSLELTGAFHLLIWVCWLSYMFFFFTVYFIWQFCFMPWAALFSAKSIKK